MVKYSQTATSNIKDVNGVIYCWRKTFCSLLVHE